VVIAFRSSAGPWVEHLEDTQSLKRIKGITCFYL
jgi:hypothetical protein